VTDLPDTTLAPVVFDGQGEVLKPYVPRLLIEWVRESQETRYRAVDGSLAFVDISGFTALTERLAKQGKIGAELMRDTLDGVFRALLDEAYDWGAGLLKWGGDALLLLFDGPGHPERVARAAWEMQRTIERVGRLRVSGGVVTLRMSIGIATGTIDFFTAGSVHRELLVAGPVATETVTIEAIADAGEIGISHSLAHCLDPSCVGPRKEQALLLVAPPDVERERSPDVGAVRGLDVAQCIPVAARAHVLLESSEPEHRTITAAFIDLMDTDVLLERLGREAFAEALDERICSIQESALRYDVPFYETDIGKGTVKALLTAGAPSSTGHDEEQMLRVLREVMDKPGVIPLRVGVNTGKVFTGDFGPPYRRAYRVFGDAINTAARVMSRAEPGQMLATEIVLDRSRTTFESTPIEPFRAKGKADLVRASIVGAIVGGRSERAAETPLVGRDEELAALLEVLDDVRAGNGWIVEISGAAGIGRSRLVQELVDRCPDVIGLHVRCEEYEASTPYFALRAPMRAALRLEPNADAAEVELHLREVVARVDQTLEPWLPLLGILLGIELPSTAATEGLDERFLRETLADVAMRFLVSTLAGTPTMLLVEDAHFMDEASADLLRRLSRAGTSLRQALLVTHSEPATTWAPTDDENLRCLSLTLLPMSEQHLVEIVSLATDEHPLSPHDAEEIARRSHGNVLFLFELLDAVRATGSTVALPDSVEAVVAAEIDRLSPADRTALRFASVLGTTFDPLQLSSALRDEVEIDDALWGRLRGLVDRDASGGMRFRNTLVRDAAYEGLPFRRRRELHGRVAEAIEATAGPSAEEDVSSLALHFFEAQRHDKAWHYCRLAGDRARAIAANVEAARFYERALIAARRVRGLGAADRADLWISLAAVRDRAGLVDTSFDALCQATRLLAGRPVEKAQVYAKRALASLHSGAYARGLRETSAGIRLVGGVAGSEALGARANLRALRAEIRWHQGHMREAIELAKAAAIDAEQAGDLHALAISYMALDAAYQLVGQPEEAVYERKAIKIWSRLGQLRSLGISELNVGVQAYADGDWDGAIEWYRRAQDDCLRAGDRATAAVAAANLGEVLVSRGTFDEADRVLTEARRALRAAGYVPHALFAETQRARIALERDRMDEALAALEAIAAEAATLGHPAIAFETVVHLAHAHAIAGDPEVGLAAVDEATAAAGDVAALFAVPVDRVRAESLTALGRLDEAERCLDSALTGAVRQRLLYEQLLVRRARRELRRRRGGEPNGEDVQEVDRLLHILGLTAETV
jgi:class 3 adenylate cyclase/tetratricopeptide (TPR) repeat protein